MSLKHVHIKGSVRTPHPLAFAEASFTTVSGGVTGEGKGRATSLRRPSEKMRRESAPLSLWPQSRDGLFLQREVYDKEAIGLSTGDPALRFERGTHFLVVGKQLALQLE